MKRFLLLICVLFSPPLFADNSFSRVIIFGDSLSDTGNLASVVGNFPNPPFFNNRVSNGPVSVETVAAGFNLTAEASLHLIGPAVGDNYSVASARTAGTAALDLSTQVNLFLANNLGVALDDALFIFFIGGNDVRDARDVQDAVVAPDIINTAVSAEVAQIQILISSGAENILVMNVPDIGSIPETAILQAVTGDSSLTRRAHRLTKRYNKLLKRQLKRLEKVTDVDIEVFDTFEVFEEIIEHASENGFTNTTEACFSSVSFTFSAGCGFGANFSQYIFFDEIHPTARVHEMIGLAVLAEINEEDDDNDKDDD